MLCPAGVSARCPTALPPPFSLQLLGSFPMVASNSFCTSPARFCLPLCPWGSRASPWLWRRARPTRFTIWPPKAGSPSDGQGCLFPQVEAIFYAPGEISSLSVCTQVEDRRETNTLQVINLRAKQELMEGTSFTRVSQFVTPSPTAAAHLCFFTLS